MKHLPHVTTEETVSTEAAIPSTGSLVAACACQGVRLVGRKLYEPITSHISWLTNRTSHSIRSGAARSKYRSEPVWFRPVDRSFDEGAVPINGHLLSVSGQKTRPWKSFPHFPLATTIRRLCLSFPSSMTRETRYKSVLISNMDHPDDPLRSL